MYLFTNATLCQTFVHIYRLNYMISFYVKLTFDFLARKLSLKLYSEKKKDFGFETFSSFFNL